MAPYPCCTESRSPLVLNTGHVCTDDFADLGKIGYHPEDKCSCFCHIWLPNSPCTRNHGSSNSSSDIWNEPRSLIRLASGGKFGGKYASFGIYDLWQSKSLVNLQCLDSSTVSNMSIIGEQSASSTLHARLLQCSIMNSKHAILLSDKDNVEVPIETTYICLRLWSPWRTHEVLAVDPYNSVPFFLDMNVIQQKSDKLAKMLSVTGCKGSIPQIRVGVLWDFEVFLRLTCGSYKGADRTDAIGKYMRKILILARQYEVPSIIEECKSFVLGLDFSKVKLQYLQIWFEGFEATETDLSYDEQGQVVSRPIRSNIISALICSGRWIEFCARLENTFYSLALKHWVKRGNVSPDEVDDCLRRFFFVLGNSYEKSGQESAAKNALQAMFPNVRVSSKIGNF